MSNYKELEIYDPIILPKFFPIAKRSRLFFLEPIGLGTPYTENLSSYLTRLAQEHCVTTKKLIMGEIAPLIMNDKYQPEMLSKNVSNLFGNSDAKPAINGMRNMTRSLTLALEQLTLREDLKYLSCLTYQGIIKEQGLFRQHKAWCPKCFKKSQQEHKTLYEPLLWSFKDVNHCLRHNQKLCVRCPHCDSQQKSISNNSRLGYCEHCKESLIAQSSNAKIEINEKEYQVIDGIGELIKAAPLLDKPPTLPELIQKLQLIQFFFERSLRQDLTQFIVLGKILEQLKIAINQHKNMPLNLVGLLIPACSLTKVSINEFLESDTSTLGQILNINLGD